MVEPYITERGGKQYMYRATSRYSPEKKGPVAETEYMGVVVDGKLRPKRGYYYIEETREFGRIDDTMTEAKRPRSCSHDVTIRTRIFGDSYLLMAIQKRLRIREDLRTSFGPEIGDMVLAVAMAYTISPSALMHMEDIIDRRCIKGSFPAFGPERRIWTCHLPGYRSSQGEWVSWRGRWRSSSPRDWERRTGCSYTTSLPNPPIPSAIRRANGEGTRTMFLPDRSIWAWSPTRSGCR